MTRRFTELYLDYAKEFTDCPDIFLTWGALLAISASLSRNVYVEIGSWNISPHIWIVLIGKSSSHKSTAISIVEDLIELVDSSRSAPHEFSAEAIIKALSENSNRLFIFDEAKAFFDLLSQSYNLSLKSLFTTLYRKPNYSRTTLKHGTLSITNAYLPMGMATTPEWLRQSLNDAEQSAMSGFLARFLMVPYLGSGNAPLPKPPPHNSMKFRGLVEQLISFSKIEQPFAYTAQADTALSDWYIQTTSRENDAPAMLGPFFEHFKNEAIHKLSMLFAVDRGESEITRPALSDAINALAYVEEMLPSLAEDLTSDTWERERRKIRDYVRSKGVCTRESLADNVHIHGEKLTRHLNGLKADNLVVFSERKTKTKPITMLEWVGGGDHERNGDG